MNLTSGLFGTLIDGGAFEISLNIGPNVSHEMVYLTEAQLSFNLQFYAIGSIFQSAWPLTNPQ